MSKLPTVNGARRPNLEGVARGHPVIPIVLAMDNRSTNANLPDFLEHELKYAENNQIPLTLAEFYHDYVQFSIQRYLRAFRERYGPQHYKWNINDAIQNLAKMAFIHFVRNARITEGMVAKLMGGSGDDHSGGGSDLEFRTFGLLVQDGVVGRRPVYRFKEPIVMEYLVARHLLLDCLRKVLSGKSEAILSGAVYESMKRLPATGDVWRMTFALLNDDQNTRKIQGRILSELIDISKTIDGLSSFDVTALCVEAIYESRNAALLTDHIDEFTLNETINYSNAFVPKSRLQYSTSAVGYFVRASSRVYGLHVANFGLNQDKVALLADPVNAVSDNYLQVLNMSRNALGVVGMRRLQRFLVKASFLTHLDMSECQLGCSGVALLAEYFMCLPLVFLNLAENEIRDKGMLRMLKNLKYLENLEWLDMSSNELTDKSILKFGEELPHLTNLRSLDLRHNHIGDAAISSISQAIVHLPHLGHVVLAENRGTDAAASRMISHAWKSRSLKHVNINLNHVPPEGVLGLRRVTLSRDMLEMPSVDDPDLESGDREFDMDDTLNSGTYTLSDSHDVSFDVIAPWEGGRAANVDLLAGRPDRERAVQLRRHGSSRAASLPRMRDVRRSWHGAGAALREGLRATRDSMSGAGGGGSSVRENLRNSTSSLRQGLRNSTSNLQQGLRNSTNSLRNRRSSSRLSGRFGRAASSQEDHHQGGSVPDVDKEGKTNHMVGKTPPGTPIDSERCRPRMYSETPV